MKKFIIALSILPTTTMAHTSAVHTVSDVLNLHFLTELDHIAMIVIGIAVVGFVGKKVITVFSKK